MILKVHCKANHSVILWFTVPSDHQETKPASFWEKYPTCWTWKIFKYSGFFFIFLRKKEDSSPLYFSTTQLLNHLMTTIKVQDIRYVTRLCIAPSQCDLKTLAASFLLWLLCLWEPDPHTCQGMLPRDGKPLSTDGWAWGGRIWRRKAIWLLPELAASFYAHSLPWRN